MTHSELIEKIKLYVSMNDFMTDKRLPTDQELDNYIVNNYNGECDLEIIEEDFITYKINDDHIFIKDFVSFGSGIELLNRVIKKSNRLNIPIRAMVHFNNTHVLNLAMKRYGFDIIGASSNQFILERKAG